MKTADAATLALLNAVGPVQVLRADLWTITTKAGTVVRLTDADINIPQGANTFLKGPVIQRSQSKQSVGVNVDSIQVTLSDAGTLLVNGKPIIQQFLNGYFDAAIVTLQKLFLSSWTDLTPAPVDWFTGRISDVSCDHMNVNFMIKDMKELLNQQQPNDVHQATCNNTLFDNVCGANAATFTFNCTATSIVDRKKFTLSGTTQADGYFELGKVKVTGGANAGLSRMVKVYAGGVVEVFNPFPYDFVSGDTLQATAGCDKTYAGGCAKIGRQSTGFKGYEFIPVPETAVEGGGMGGTAGSSGSTGGGTVGSAGTAGKYSGTYTP